MHTFFTSIALVASASLSLAAPAAEIGRCAFEVKQVAGGKIFKNGPLQMLSTYNKFAKAGAKAPSDVIAAAAAQQTGSVTATPEQFDQAYTCPVTVGTSKLNLDFDTGSADLWVFSSFTPKSQAGSHSVYTPGSSAQKLSGESFSITYGDQSGAAGYVYADKVDVGGVTATSQAVEAATSVSTEFVDDAPSDGLMGLAFSSINQITPTKKTTFFDTVSSTLAKKLFTADLKKGTAGSYTFGYIDSSKYTGSITYLPVDDSQGFWQFTAGGYSVGSNNATTGSLGTSIVDTGTSLFYLPAAAVKAYYSGVSSAKYNSAQGGYTYSCSATLPNFNVALGGKTFTVPGSYINYAPLTSGSSTCFGGIQANTGIGFNIFGDVFIKSAYIVFDKTQSTPRVGFAAQ